MRIGRTQDVITAEPLVSPVPDRAAVGEPAPGTVRDATPEQRPEHQREHRPEPVPARARCR